MDVAAGSAWGRPPGCRRRRGACRLLAAAPVCMPSAATATCVLVIKQEQIKENRRKERVMSFLLDILV
jgi:hypothetical protein